MVRIRFGEFRFDSEQRELVRASDPVHLPPKAFQLLELLIGKRPNPISQEVLQDGLWPDTIVDPGSLHNLIYQLRRALADRDQEIIRTVHGYGFAFAAEAISDAPGVSPCALTIGDRDFILGEGETVIGRDWAAAVRIDAPSMSRRHARIHVNSGRATIEDLGSKNGTIVAGRRLRAVRELADGDQIVFGTVAAKFRVLPALNQTDSM